MKLIARCLILAGALAFASPADAGGRPLSADLSGLNEVPPNDLGATGTAELTLNQGQNEICVDISTSGVLSPIFAGHIHAAPAGQNGPVVVNLGVSITPGDNDFSACVEAPADLIKEIRKSPGDYYVNLHSVSVPSGEIRGQLSK